MKLKFFSLILFIMSFIAVLPAMAQGGALTYGSSVVGTLSAQSPIGFYTFSGSAGDVVTVQVIGISNGLDPSVSLNAPTQQQLAFNDNDPLSAVPTDARVTITLPANGIYTVLISSVNGTLGDYLIRLNGQAAVQTEPIQSDTPVDTTVNPDQGALFFQFEALPDTPQTVTITSLTDGFSFRVIVRNPQGETIALLTGSNQLGLNIPAGTGTYTLEVAALTSGLAGQISVQVAPTGTPPVDVTPPAETPDDQDNVDDEPVTTEEPQQTIIEATPTFTPTATTVQEEQQQQPTATTAQQQQQQATATFTPSYTPTTQATATFTPSYTPTTQPTATFTPSYTPTTPPPPPTAPEDARFNSPLNIQLDTTVSVTDFVSYPGGDVEDRVRWDIIGMNQNSSLSGGRARLVIAVSCFGTNTQDVQFFTGGQTYSCGQTIVDREVTYDSRTGSVVITAVSGQSTYVQWVLTGTATRVN